MIVADTSAIVDYLIGSTEVAERVRGEFERHEVAAPHSVDLECASALRGLVLSGRLAAERGQEALAVLARMPLRRFDHVLVLPRVWEMRENAWPYDAAYLALAELLDADLVTVDGKLARVPGIRCTVRNLRDG